MTRTSNRTAPRTRALFAVVAVVLVLVGATAPAMGGTPDDSPSPPPAAYYGTLLVGGQPAPAGLTVVARIDGEVRGRLTTTRRGQYGAAAGTAPKLVVNGTDADRGATVTFHVQGVRADATVTWGAGDVAEVDLSVPRLPEEAPSTTPGGGGGNGGSGGGGGGGPPSSAAIVKRTGTGATVEVIDGRAGSVVQAPMDGVGDGTLTFEGLSIELSEDTGDVTVSVQPQSTAPGDVPAPSNGDPVHYFTVETSKEVDDAIDRAELSFRIAPDALPAGTDLTDLVVLRHHDGEWQPLPTTVSGDELVVETPGFSAFAVAVGRPDVSVATAHLDASTVQVGETAAATVTLANAGTAEGTRTVEVTADGEVLASREVTVPAGGRREVTLTWTPKATGSHEVTVGGVSAGALEVVGQGQEATTERTTTVPPSTSGTSAATESTENRERAGFAGVLVVLLVAVASVGALVYLRRRRSRGGRDDRLL